MLYLLFVIRIQSSTRAVPEVVEVSSARQCFVKHSTFRWICSRLIASLSTMATAKNAATHRLPSHYGSYLSLISTDFWFKSLSTSPMGMACFFSATMCYTSLMHLGRRISSLFPRSLPRSVRLALCCLSTHHPS